MVVTVHFNTIVLKWTVTDGFNDLQECNNLCILDWLKSYDYVIFEPQARSPLFYGSSASRIHHLISFQVSRMNDLNFDFNFKNTFFGIILSLKNTYIDIISSFKNASQIIHLQFQECMTYYHFKYQECNKFVWWSLNNI